MLEFFPKYFSNKAIFLYIITLIIVSILFSTYSLPFIYLIFGIIHIIIFFYFSNLLTSRWTNLSKKKFLNNLVVVSLILRVSWVVLSYFLFIKWTGIPFEWSAKDSLAYHEEAIWLKSLIIEGNTKPYFDYLGGNISDAGYTMYLGFFYYIFGESIILARLFKAVYSTITVYLVYKLASRTFGESTGRMAGVFSMLLPNLIYYTGTHLKEVEMIFLTVWFIERADALLRGHKFTFNMMWLPILLASSLFFFRTVLGVTAIFGLFSAIFLSTERTAKFSKRIIATIWFSVALFYFVGSQYFNEVSSIWQSRISSQTTSMEWRAEREGGNKFAKYATATVFAPIIFIIPFSSMVYVENQDYQMFSNGANFIKNIFSFFIIFAIYSLIKEKKWRDYLLILTFFVGYLAVISMSSFAHSERFHQPILPFYLIIVAYGISKITNKQKKYFIIYSVFIFLVTIGWSWFKLSGRGLI
jgi:4-amino-4-deoxy-L-arabinose transferase-like glycosyltransferase